MSRRNILKRFQLFNQEDTTTDPQSDHTDISQLDNVTYELSIDNTVNANLDIYYCNTERFDQSQAEKLGFSSQIVLNGATDTKITIHIKNLGFKWLYLKLTDNGGSGNIDAFITGNVGGA